MAIVLSRGWSVDLRVFMDELSVVRRKILVVALVVGIVAGVGLSLRQIRQIRLDHALLAAIRRRDETAATALLDEGADANAAEWIGRVESPATLFKSLGYWLHGRRPPNRGFTMPALSLVYAARFQRPLRAQPESPSRPQYSAETPFLRALLEHGADPNNYPGGSSPLEMAVRLDDAEAVRLLLEHHADPNAVGQADAVPLMFAGPDCARLLLEHAAWVSARNRLGQTPLMTAVTDRSDRAAELAGVLLDHGADPQARDAYGQTVLMHAVRVDVAGLLLAHGAPIDARAPTWMTALMMDCANHSDPNLPAFLVAHGASVLLRDRLGKSPLDYAKASGRRKLCAFLAAAEGRERARIKEAMARRSD